MSDSFDKFNEYTGLIFAAAYESFPILDHLAIGQFVQEVTTRTMRGEQLTDEAILFNKTLTWLIENDYLRAEKVIPEIGALKVYLTDKALVALEKMPNSLEPPLGKQLVIASKSGAKQALKSLASSVIAVAVNAV